MSHRIVFATAFLAAATGSALAQPMHTIDVWGARIEVPNQGPGGLFGDRAPLSRDVATGATVLRVPAAGPLAHTAPARLDTRGRRP
ncbi:hypothetical protein VQ03_28520 [Methylobacterium tarhaniae]|uniref:Uncharacterized protein n=1 Tax=Methylobacterium tarhaniae TaxID=1187852 RepID=A0A0J6S9J4_9HYPH|nr:hypothetical protein [Methylobacterium tarhaniae]KMO30357.1 hypothetical protein VQ03_28520 [Methylobacterium tarhaniae]